MQTRKKQNSLSNNHDYAEKIAYLKKRYSFVEWQKGSCESVNGEKLLVSDPLPAMIANQLATKICNKTNFYQHVSISLHRSTFLLNHKRIVIDMSLFFDIREQLRQEVMHRLPYRLFKEVPANNTQPVKAKNTEAMRFHK